MAAASRGARRWRRHANRSAQPGTTAMVRPSGDTASSKACSVDSTAHSSVRAPAEGPPRFRLDTRRRSSRRPGSPRARSARRARLAMLPPGRRPGRTVSACRRRTRRRCPCGEQRGVGLSGGFDHDARVTSRNGMRGDRAVRTPRPGDTATRRADIPGDDRHGVEESSATT